MAICDIIAEQSYAKRAKVGAVLVKDNNIISFGFNGMPSKFDNCCEYVDENGEMHTKCEVLHAESNALMKLCKTGSCSSNGATLYCTYSPCIDCAKMIVQAGLHRVVYRHRYRTTEGLTLLQNAGIIVEQFESEQNDVLYE